MEKNLVFLAVAYIQFSGSGVVRKCFYNYPEFFDSISINSYCFLCIPLSFIKASMSDKLFSKKTVNGPELIRTSFPE